MAAEHGNRRHHLLYVCLLLSQNRKVNNQEVRGRNTFETAGAPGLSYGPDEDSKRYKEPKQDSVLPYSQEATEEGW